MSSSHDRYYHQVDGNKYYEQDQPYLRLVRAIIAQGVTDYAVYFNKRIKYQNKLLDKSLSDREIGKIRSDINHLEWEMNSIAEYITTDLAAMALGMEDPYTKEEAIRKLDSFSINKEKRKLKLMTMIV